MDSRAQGVDIFFLEGGRGGYIVLPVTLVEVELQASVFPSVDGGNNSHLVALL